eukprot:GHVS01014086.1.p1 GENE.GHVS01014086.1~~GHVS01014086.1.p1  ORF type:complete len:209 (-),score=63.59 GHVS01014086.1:262-888(-)
MLPQRTLRFGFFLPAALMGGLGLSHHFASRELDDIYKQAETPLFGFWWGVGLGVLAGVWVGANFHRFFGLLFDFGETAVRLGMQLLTTRGGADGGSVCGELRGEGDDGVGEAAGRSNGGGVGWRRQGAADDRQHERQHFGGRGEDRRSGRVVGMDEDTDSASWRSEGRNRTTGGGGGEVEYRGGGGWKERRGGGVSSSWFDSRGDQKH